MSQEYYELLALTSRYLFALLGVSVVWQAARWLKQDSNDRKSAQGALPDAGYLGMLYIMEGAGKQIYPGCSYQLPAEGLLGSGSVCDVRVAHPDVSRKHFLFEFKNDGMHLRPCRNKHILVDGQILPKGCEAILTHGATLTIGDVIMQLRMYSGVQIAVPPDDEEL